MKSIFFPWKNISKKIQNDHTEVKIQPICVITYILSLLGRGLRDKKVITRLNLITSSHFFESLWKISNYGNLLRKSGNLSSSLKWAVWPHGNTSRSSKCHFRDIRHFRTPIFHRNLKWLRNTKSSASKWPQPATPKMTIFLSKISKF